MLLYRLTNFNRITGFSFRWYFSLAFNNTSHLLAITGLSLGIKAMKSFYISQSEKLLLQREKIRKEGELLKARMYPEVIKQSLTVLSDRVNSGFNGASELLMAVSDVFSYLLYSSNQSVIDIRKELGLIRNIAYLENSMENNSHLISVLVAGDCEGFVIRPLVLFSILQACITLLHRQKGCTIELQFEINIVDRQISVVVEFNSLGDPGDEHFHWSDLIAKHLEGRPAVDNPLYRIGKSAHNGVQIWIDTQKNAFVSHGFAPNTK